MNEHKVVRSELETRICMDTGCTRDDVRAVLDSLTAIVRDTLQQGGAVVIKNLGRFEMRDVAQKRFTNPRTKEELTLAAKQRPAFKFSVTFREKMNRK